MKKKLFLFASGCILAGLLLIHAIPVLASTITFNLDYQFSDGGTDPAGTAPWLTATFQDTGTDEVTLTMNSSGLTGFEKVTEWYFNLSDSALLAPPTEEICFGNSRLTL